MARSSDEAQQVWKAGEGRVIKTRSARRLGRRQPGRGSQCTSSSPTVTPQPPEGSCSLRKHRRGTPAHSICRCELQGGVGGTLVRLGFVQSHILCRLQF